jgi:hypothetical protein
VADFINTVAFGRRCIPSRDVARRSNTPGILPPRALRDGRLGFLKYAMCPGFTLDNDRGRARAWMGEVEKDVAYGDGRKHIHSAVILALAPEALRKLRLDADALNMFPFAFLDGMASASRSRILGDDAGSASPKWMWGGPGREVDGILLLYADSPALLADLRDRMSACLRQHGHEMVVEVPFPDLPDKERDRATAAAGEAGAVRLRRRRLATGDSRHL